MKGQIRKDGVHRYVDQKKRLNKKRKYTEIETFGENKDN